MDGIDGSGRGTPTGRAGGFAAAVYRGRLAVPFGGLCAVVGGFLIWDALAGGEGRDQRLAVTAVLFGLALVHALAVRPAVLADDAGLRLRNIVRDIDLPWSQVARVTTDWGLVVDTVDGDRYPAWAIAGTGRRGRAGAADVTPPPRDLALDTSANRAGDVARVLTARQALWERDRRGVGEGPVRVRPAWASFVPVLVTAAALLAALAG